MNQNNFSVQNFCKKLLISTLTVCAVFVFLVVVVSFLFYQIPHYENYFGFFPWVIMLLVALITSLLCRSSGKSAPVLALAVSGVFSLLCIIIGVIWGFDSAQIPMFIARLVVFMASSSLFALLFTRAKGKRRASSKKFRFSK